VKVRVLEESRLSAKVVPGSSSSTIISSPLAEVRKIFNCPWTSRYGVSAPQDALHAAEG